MSKVLTPTSQVNINDFIGLTGNIQDQLNSISAKKSNIITLSKINVNLNANKLYQDITITQTGDADLIVMVEDSSIANVEYISGNTYRITGLTSGSTNVIILAPQTSGYGANSQMISVKVAFATNVLDDNDWETISIVSAMGEGANYWSVGDKKKIVLNGTVGTLELSNFQTYVYILGFNHNSQIQGAGISFGGFKDSTGKELCLVDSHYNDTNISGSKWFNMNHQRSSASQSGHHYGGWKGCDMRYDILGSTDVAPSTYNTGSAAMTVGRYGNDPTSTCTSNPVANTLMAALSSELRAVMKPIIKYTDNASSNSGVVNVSTVVTSSIDYLPLLAQFEIFGLRSQANQHQQNKQAQYQYFANGNSKIKYKYNTTSTTACWWMRSPVTSDVVYFCYVSTSGDMSHYRSSASQGVAPIFLV